jgi:hypothetical protein
MIDGDFGWLRTTNSPSIMFLFAGGEAKQEGRLSRRGG